MNPALVLIDLQPDFLNGIGLQPAAGVVIHAAARLLAGCRNRGVPVFHVVTTVQREPDNRMPHWKMTETWRCVEGSAGHESPRSLAHLPSEPVISKRFFSGFGSGELDQQLKTRGCDTLILAGVHLHACVRALAFDAYERGYGVWIAEDAVASDDPLHAAITRRYLERRAATFASVDQLIAMLTGTRIADKTFAHVSPHDRRQELWHVGFDDRSAVNAAAVAAKRGSPAWQARESANRAEVLRRWAANLLAEAEPLAALVVSDIGKPITQARAEIRRSADLLMATAGLASEPLSVTSSKAARFRYVPLGVVAIITPYNNPVAIPVGKIGPALLYGNTVVWKPAPAASMIGRRVLELARKAGVPEDVLLLCTGDRASAMRLAEDENIDGVTVSGSALAGFAIQEVCARRSVPYQGELGGNNAAIVWDDAELSMAASEIVAGAFGFAGQRCTANRRVVVAEAIAKPFLLELEQATARLRWGDPMHPDTLIGPLISVGKRDAIDGLVRRSAAVGCQSRVPHRNQQDLAELIERGAYYPPTIVLADDPSHEIVQEESFGPLLVVQRAPGFDRAIELCNGVRQGLVASVFSSSPELRARFMRDAHAGVLKINAATADADAVSPLGGWKASGVGPAEHGPSDREFYCRVQTVYGDVHGEL